MQIGYNKDLYVEFDFQSLKRSYEIITVNYFCIHHKNRWKHNQYFLNCYISKKNCTLANQTNYLHIEN